MLTDNHSNEGFFQTVPLNFSATALSADQTTAAVDLGKRRNVSLTLDVTDVSSSDTLDTTIQTSRDGVNNWYTAHAFTQVTAASAQRKSFACDRYIRAVHDVTGAAISITFTLVGEAA